jgi:hypothetical protein
MTMHGEAINLCLIQDMLFCSVAKGSSVLPVLNTACPQTTLTRNPQAMRRISSYRYLEDGRAFLAEGTVTASASKEPLRACDERYAFVCGFNRARRW